jgi:hypothetical protein
MVCLIKPFISMEKIIRSLKINPARIWQGYQNDAWGSVEDSLVEAVCLACTSAAAKSG